MRLPADQVRRLRLRAQGLWRDDKDAPKTPAAVLRDACAVQAQDAPAAALSIWARSDGLTAGDVARAQAQEHSIVRTWLMRGTLHLTAAEDLGWLLPLLGPRFIRTTRRRYAELGLDGAVRRESLVAIREILSEGVPMLRAELAARLAERGFPTEGQAAYALMHHAGLSGLLCFGPDREGQETFVLLEGWTQVGEAMPESEALAELARRYLRAYAPAAPQDLAAWSGLPIPQARAAFEAIGDQLVEVEFAREPLRILQGQAGWLEEAFAGEVNLRLLPRFDTYLMGYRDRALSVPERYARRIHPGGGILHPAVLVDGLAAGRWKTARKKARLDVIVEPFESLAGEAVRQLEAEVRDLARFLETEVRLEPISR